MKNKSKYGHFIIFISLIVISIISCGYDAGGVYRASGDYASAALADMYYKNHITTIIILSIIFAIIGGIIAYKKGRSVIGWVILCGLFWVIPLIVIAALSNLSYDSSKNYKSTDYKNKKCRQCGNIYSSGLNCPSCGSSLYEEINTVSGFGKPTQVNFGETWVCKNCSERNPITASTCKGCGEYK